MVSLKSFKPLDETERDEESGGSGQQTRQLASGQPAAKQQRAAVTKLKLGAERDELEAASSKSSSSASSISVVVVKHEGVATKAGAIMESDEPDELTDSYAHEASSQDQSLGESEVGAGPTAEIGPVRSIYHAQVVVAGDDREHGPVAVPLEVAPVAGGGGHFEIVWSNLSYRIEPKWYKKINLLDRALSRLLPSQGIDIHSSATSTASSSAGMNDNQHQMHNPTNTEPAHHLNKMQQSAQQSKASPIEIFTNLNGTIRSGQMTAVLGPSGKLASSFVG